SPLSLHDALPIYPLIDPAGRCRFDPSALVALLPPAERYNLYTAGHLVLTNDLQLYGSASYTQSRQEYRFQTSPISDQFAFPATDPLANQAPYNQGGPCRSEEHTSELQSRG